MYGCESWTMKKAEHWRTDAFELWCWRRLLRIPWTARSTQSTLKEINPEYSLEELMLKLQYSGHLMWRADSLEKTLMLGKIEGGRRRGQQRKRWLEGITDSQDASSRRRSSTGKPGVLQSMGLQRVRHDWATEQLVDQKDCVYLEVGEWPFCNLLSLPPQALLQNIPRHPLSQQSQCI